MDNAKSQLVEKLKSATNILVTVSRNPSVDQLAATVGLTLLLNKLNKHATAVFSGEVPSTLEFLQPEQTLEKNTDSLRDFIIALDKSKADKLRYKVEDEMVRIFITPYRTSISQEDLEFSQGDFNVDVVVALGVQQQEDLDEAIIAHGRILHDATVASLTTGPESGLGTINWNDPQASSLSELVSELVDVLGKELLDGQIATALLTGIVAETARFSNEKTSPRTMSLSAELMSAGANQQLVATKLEEGSALPPAGDHTEPDDDNAAEPPTDQPEPPKTDPGTLEINHPAGEEPAEDAGQPEATAPEPSKDAPASDAADAPAAEDTTTGQAVPKTSKLIVEPPTLGGTLTANSTPEMLDPTTDPLSLPAVEQALLSHDGHVTSSEQPVAVVPPASEPPAAAAPTPIVTGFTPPPPAWVPPTDPAVPAADPAPAIPEVTPTETLTEIESAVHSPHIETPTLDTARDEVLKALNSTPPAPEPIQALNAQPIDLNPTNEPAEQAAAPPASTAFDPTAFGVVDDPELPPATAQANDPNAPPPVPPPIPFQFGTPPASDQK